MALTEALTGGVNDTLEEARQYLQAEVMFGQEYRLMAPALGERMLDVGCSSGHFGGLLRERGHHVTGLDRNITPRARRRLDATCTLDVTSRDWAGVPDSDAAITRLLLRHVDPGRRAEVVRRMSEVARTVVLGLAGPVEIEGLEGGAVTVVEAVDSRLVDGGAVLDEAGLDGTHLGRAEWVADSPGDRAAFRFLLRPALVVAPALGLEVDAVARDLDRWLARGGRGVFRIDYFKGVRA